MKYREAQLYESVLAPRFLYKRYREFHISWQKFVPVYVRNTKNSIFHEETVMPMLVMVTSFKRTYARTVRVSTPEPMAGHC